MTKRASVFILSGFLGSGKTTLLAKAIDYCTQTGRKPAVIMNELGEVNLDGQQLQADVPMAEMLNGCICCSSRGDLGMSLRELAAADEPDVIWIESTGAANPLQVIDEVTDASMIAPVELKGVITIVDAVYLLELERTSRGKTYRLMQEQIRCADLLLVNKTDLLPAAETAEITALVREWNPHASLRVTSFSELDFGLLDGLAAGASRAAQPAAEHPHECGPACNHGHADGHDHGAEQAQEAAHAHAGHEHVMAYTHYFQRPVDSAAFEAFVGALPKEVYRAKGILRFTDTNSRFMFQFAYREMDFVKITPQGEVPDVAVFIGEHFSKEAVRSGLLKLEAGDETTGSGLESGTANV